MGNYWWYDRTNSLPARTVGAGLRIPRSAYEKPGDNNQRSVERFSVSPMPIKQGFWANYSRQVLSSVVGLALIAVLVILGLTFDLPSAVPFAALPLSIFTIALIARPIHSYISYKKMTALAGDESICEEESRLSWNPIY